MAFKRVDHITAATDFILRAFNLKRESLLAYSPDRSLYLGDGYHHGKAYGDSWAHVLLRLYHPPLMARLMFITLASAGFNRD